MFDKSTIPPGSAMYEHVDAINKAIARVRAHLKDSVDISSLDDIPMIQAQGELFFQAHLRRALAFLDGGKCALDAGHGLVAITAVRCIYESAACIHDFCNQALKLIDDGNIPDAVRLAHRRSFAQRFEVQQANTEMYDFTAVNILKQIDAMDKALPDTRRSYEQLSEFVHPNARGSLYYFINPGDGDKAIQFHIPTNDRTTTMGLFLAGASLFGFIDDDLWRFQKKMLNLWADELQRRVDDYEARKARGEVDE